MRGTALRKDTFPKHLPSQAQRKVLQLHHPIWTLPESFKLTRCPSPRRLGVAGFRALCPKVRSCTKQRSSNVWDESCHSPRPTTKNLPLSDRDCLREKLPWTCQEQIECLFFSKYTGWDTSSELWNWICQRQENAESRITSPKQWPHVSDQFFSGECTDMGG